MVHCEIILTSYQAIGLSLSFIIMTAAIITLILRINKSNQDKLDKKLDVAIFATHEKSQSADFGKIKEQMESIFEDMEKNEKEMKLYLSQMNAISSNVVEIKTDVKWINKWRDEQIQKNKRNND